VQIVAEIFYYDAVTIKPWTYLLAATDLGLYYLGLQNDPSAPLLSFYPGKMLVRDAKRLAPYVQELKEYFAGQRREFDLDLDISEFGTPFQRSVLEVVRRVPYGQTVNYGDIATSLDNARSVRAVSHAITLNPVLLYIPSHRIIMADGKIGSYRLGAKEKQRLIDFEKEHVDGNS
jgi:O-6-methylguanine DNA methyltransferase